MAKDGTVTVKITGDSKGLKDALDDSDGRLGKFGGRIGGVAKGIGTAFAGMGVAAFGFGAVSVKAFMEAEQVAAQTGAVLKSTGGIANVTAKDVETLAGSLSKMSGVDDELIASGENLLLTFTKVRNETGKGNDIFNQATESALNMSVALGTDMTSASMLVGKALNDPIKGMTALTRSGIQFTDAQKDQIKALVASGDEMGAQKIILKELETQFGGSAEAAGGTFAGQLGKLKTSLGNVMEEVGARLVPVLIRLGEWLGANLPKALVFLAPLFDALKDAFNALGVWWNTNGPKIIDALKKFIDKSGEIADNVIPVLKELVEDVLGALKQFWDDHGTTIVNAIKAVGTAVEDIAVAIGAAVTTIIDNWDDIDGPLKVTAGLIAALVIPHFIALGVQATLAAVKVAAAWVVTQTSAIAAVVVHSVQVGIMVAKWVLLGAQALFHAAVVVAGWVLTSVGAIAAGVVMAVQAGIFVAKWILMGAVAMTNAVIIAAAWVIALGPIALLIAAVIAAVVLIVIHWDTIKRKAGELKEWVVEKFNAVVEFFKGLPGKIANAASGMWDGLKDAFRGALNWIIRGWNALEFKMPGFDTPLGKVGGFTLGVPDIPLLAAGGIVRRPTLAMLGEAGPEAVIPLSRMGGAGGSVNYYSIAVTAIDPAAASEAVITAIKEYERRNGTNWRVA